MGIFSEVGRRFFFQGEEKRQQNLEDRVEDIWKILDLSHHQKDTLTLRTLPGPFVKLRPTRSLEQLNLTQLKPCTPLNTTLLPHGLLECMLGSASAECVCAYLPKAPISHYIIS